MQPDTTPAPIGADAPIQIPRELLDRLAPDEPMNQDEMGGCVWCGGTPPGERYGYAGTDPAHHAPDCPWTQARAALASAAQPTARRWPPVSGVGRDAGHSRAAMVYLADVPTDDELRALHDAVRGEAAAAPKAAPAQPLQEFESPRAKTLMRAWEEGWEACRDAEFVGEEAQNDAFNRSNTVNQCIAEDQLHASRGQAPAPTTQAAPALQYDAATGTFEGETLHQAAENWAQWCERRCLGGLPQFLRAVGRIAAARSEDMEGAFPGFVHEAFQLGSRETAAAIDASRAAKEGGA